MFLLEHETLIRLACFAGLLAILALAERVLPRRRQQAQRVRQLNNLGLAAVNAVAIRFLVPVSAVGMALLAEQHTWGLFQHTPFPGWLTVMLSLIALDLAIWAQHVLFHAVPAFWRLHRVHHADRELDVTTGLRFHTLEILLSALIKVAVVAVLGPPAVAVVLFEVLLNASSLFNHSNLRLPLWLDGIVRLVLVTPDMHRVHHSVDRAETNSNFGFNLPWWDMLFGTYRAQPAAGHETMELGVKGWQDRGLDRLPAMLAMPFLPEGTPEAAAPTGRAAPREQLAHAAAPAALGRLHR